MQSSKAVHRISRHGKKFARQSETAHRRRAVFAEALEDRLLLSGTAALSAQPIITAGNTMQRFTVVYTDSAGINNASIGRGNLTVTGPNGLTMAASYDTVNQNSGGTATVVYTVNAPGGNFVPAAVFAGSGSYTPYSSGTGSAATFTTADNGTYTVALNANSVKDNSGAAFAAGPIGTFGVSISSQTTTEAQFTHTIIDPSPGSMPTTKALIDIYGNGFEEPLVGHHDNTGLYYYQPQSWSDPTGPWVKYTIASTGDYYEDMQIADVNGDGYEDIIASIGTGNGSYSMYWLENPLGYGGNPTQPWPQFLIGTGLGHNITTADLDDDGKLDIITQRTIYFQNTPTSWTQVDAPQLDLGNVDGIAAVDVLNNGIYDIAGVSNDLAGHPLTLFENPLNTGGNPRTAAWTEHPIGPGYDSAGGSVSFASGDFTGDGRNDLVSAPSERDNGAVYAPPGGLILWLAPANPFTTAWTPITVDSSFTDVHKVDVADINGDGNLDIIAAEQEQSVNQRISIFYNLGGGLNWQQQILANSGSQNQRIGDLTDNGLLDIFGANHGFFGAPHQIEAWFQTGTPVTSVPAAPEDLTADAYNNSEITLQWQPTSSIVNGYQNALGYIIERSTDDQDFDQIAQVDLGTFTYADTSAKPNVRYYYRVAATDASGLSAYTNVASTGIGNIPTTDPPTITTQPVSQSVVSGDPITFTAAAIGDPAPTIQWEFSTDAGKTFSTIAGATSTTLSFGDASPIETGYEYQAVFTNSLGTATTTAATLTVTSAAAPTITTEPTSQSVSAGTAVSFTAAASGAPTPTIQWELSTDNGGSFSPISGATSSTLSIGAATLSENGYEYEAVFTNTAGTATTTAATLTVTQPPSGSLAGTESTAAASYNLTTLGTADWVHWGRGGSASNFDHDATGGSQISNVTKLGPGSYGGWTYSGRDVSWTNGSPTTSNAGDDGYIWANNAIGAGYSFTVPADTTSRTLYVYLGGYSSGGTLDAHLSDGSAADYTVSMSGSGNYQDVVAITYAAASAGQTLTITYDKTQTIGAASGSVDLMAAWLAGPAPSAKPTITTNPTSQSVTSGSPVTFIAAATGSPTPTVQWLVSTDDDDSFSTIVGATSTTLSIGTTTVSEDGYEYKAVFTNSAGTTTSTAATLTVNPLPVAPTITTNPQSVTLSTGAPVSFSAAATGTPMPSISWLESADNGQTYAIIGGESSPTLSFIAEPANNGELFEARFVNSAGTATTTPAMLTVVTAPTITTNPQSQSVVAGMADTLTAAATGTPAPAVQWELSTDNGGTYSTIAGATNTTLSLGAVTVGENGFEYEAVFTNAAGTATTTPATLTVSPAVAPTITTDPLSQSVSSGTDVIFTAAATGTSPVNVRWDLSTDGGRTFDVLDGATSTTLDIGAATASETGYEYKAVFVNLYGTATTTAATLLVDSPELPPTVTTQPTSLSILSGGDASFSAAAIGNPIPTVQWEVSTDDGGTFNTIAGATSDTLDLGPTTATENGNEYEAIFTNPNGTATTAPATLYVEYYPPFAPTVVGQPDSQTAIAGVPVMFTGAALGNPTPTYQWELSTDDGISFSPIPGQTNLALDLTATLSENGYEYEEVFSNSLGTATTAAATLTVTPSSAPTITTNPQSQFVLSGANVTLTAAASGAPTPSVTWELSTDGGNNFSFVPGGQSTSLTITNFAASESGDEYEAIFSNPAGSVTTTPAVLTVMTAPTMTTNPLSQSVTAGANVSFTAAASGAPTPTIQWELSTDNGGSFSPISGATSSTLSIGAATLSENGYEYEAVFTNTAGTATTTAATLTVTQPPSGSLAGTESTAAASYNLTTLGTADWVHWGRGGSASNFDHDATGGSQISNVTKLGPGSYGGWTYSGRDVSWTNGSPTTSNAGDDGYIWANNAIGAGYSFTVPADTTSRTLYVYLGGYSSGGTLDAHLSDGSAADYTVSMSGSGNYQDVVAITYAAASAGQTLTITYDKTQTIGAASGSVDLDRGMACRSSAIGQADHHHQPAIAVGDQRYQRQFLRRRQRHAHAHRAVAGQHQ